MQDTMFIGLDVHKATISVAVAQGERGGEVRHWGTIPNRPDHVRKLAEKLGCDGDGSAFVRAFLLRLSPFDRKRLADQVRAGLQQQDGGPLHVRVL
ncbi:hypothetical protein [Cereibacter sphaeroides]|uniref:hypothetical protein n=1 Tax=Cereibacter sphaeroides TaxID=1063 RepID=UPI001F1FAD19|nr:hypothetical protein [Cereibacter sphaeroides]MCE6967003.1 hypothetical protein [Cereibacter sphaeroides]